MEKYSKMPDTLKIKELERNSKFRFTSLAKNMSLIEFNREEMVYKYQSKYCCLLVCSLQTSKLLPLLC